MKIVLCYIAVTHGPIVDDYAARFVTTYQEYPPGVDHDTLVICNGGPLKTTTTLLFSGMNSAMFPRENDAGWDISGYISAAKGPAASYDMMLCLGESNYFHRTGWLKRISDAWSRYGPGMYGPYSSNAVRAHLNTTAFCCPPVLLQQYPALVANRADRYEFEHGANSLWRRTAQRGMPTRLVTWDGEWEPRMWRVPQNILWRGDQTNCLMWCNHADGYAALPPQGKSRWSKMSDIPFR